MKSFHSAIIITDALSTTTELILFSFSLALCIFASFILLPCAVNPGLHYLKVLAALFKTPQLHLLCLGITKLIFKVVGNTCIFKQQHFICNESYFKDVMALSTSLYFLLFKPLG